MKDRSGAAHLGAVSWLGDSKFTYIQFGFSMSRYAVDVKLPIDFIEFMIMQFLGDGNISFEGDLAYFDNRGLQGITYEETEILKSNVLSPEKDFIVVPLSPENAELIIKNVLRRVGLQKNVHHVQIESQGKLVCAAYDWFRYDTVWVLDIVEEEVIRGLLENGIIHSYTIEDQFFMQRRKNELVIILAS